jgi:hypothetical protein
MADTTFADQSTPIVASWLNDINISVYRAIGAGGVAPTTPAIVRTNIGAAISGANGDITSLTGLTTPLSIGQGGTAATTVLGARTSLAVSGLADNNTFTGTNTFSGTGNNFTNPLVVPNAVLGTQAIPKGQADTLYAPAAAVKQLQSLTASVASNALTVNYAGGTLDFRSPTLTNGAPVAGVAIPALSVVAPSGSTLGGTNTVSMRIVVLVLYNGGTPQLGIVNLAGGINLDETTLLSTTAISAGATAANVVYSTTAVTNSPFRVIGFFDNQCSSPSTWVNTPSLVQGTGGQALAALSSLGYGQAPQNVTGSRSLGATYYNTTGRPIFITGYAINTGSATLYVSVGGVSCMNFTAASGAPDMPFYGLVPPGFSYVVALGSGTANMGTWNEFR